MLSATANFRLITENMPRTLELTRNQPVVSRQTEYYLENISNVDTIDEFLDDYQLFSYAMKAHGLEDMIYGKAFMRKVLEEGIDNDESFANSLVDTRYREFAETFNFERHGETATTFTRAQQGTVDKFLRQTVEEDAGAQSEGVRLALYFERKAAEIENVYELLADPALLKVTQVVLGFSAATGAIDIEKQADMITERFDIEDLQDPDKLDELLTRFTTLWETENGSGFSIANASAALIGGQPLFGISGDLLASIQGLKLGGT